MADQFKASVRFEASDADSVWSLSEYVAHYVNDMLDSLDAYVRPTRISLRAVDGSTVERDDIPALRAAAREHHLEPDYVHAGFVLKRGVTPPASGDELEELKFSIEVDLNPDISVDVWGRFRAAARSRFYVDARLESSDKLILDALKARLDAERDHVAIRGTGDRKRVATSKVVAAGARANLPARQGEPSASPTRETTSSWMRRTWRDHTAALLYTVVGGLIVVVLGVWLGLTR